MANKKKKNKKKKPLQKKVTDQNNFHKIAMRAVLSQITSLAESGDAPSQVLLGETLESGKACEKNIERAIFWYKKAAAQSNEKAKEHLHRLYSSALIEEKGFDAAIAYLEEQSDKGDSYATYALASIFFEGEHPDGEKALAFAQKGIGQKDADCYALLGKAYFEGIQLKRNYSEAVRLWTKGAEEAENSSCFYFLGKAYFSGKGVSRNYSTAVEFFDRAAINRHKEAIRALANCYLEGKGTGAKDPQKANALLATIEEAETDAPHKVKTDVLSEMSGDKKLMRAFTDFFPSLAKSIGNFLKGYDPEKIYECSLLILKDANHKEDKESLGAKMMLVAAQRGYAPAMFSVSSIYSAGFADMAKDTTKALYWCKRAADAGYPKAQQEYANYLAQGVYVAPDMKSAFSWWLKAAEAGLEESIMYVSKSYFSGQGVEQDTEQGLIWAKKAAEKDVLQAFIMLGRKYLLGEDGLKQDFGEAIAWFTKADAKMEKEAYESKFLTVVPKEGILAAQFGSLYLDLYTPRKKKALQKFIDFTQESRFSAAQFLLGQFYDQGEFVKKDTKRALFYFSLAAEQGFPEASFYLALYKLKGIEEPENKAQGMAFLRKAAARESILAARYLQDGESSSLKLELVEIIKAALFLRFTLPENLLKRGYDYFSGIHGVPKKTQKALEFWIDAAEQGILEAQNNLAFIAATDNSFMARNMDLALLWWRRAACEGSLEATLSLAELYETGDGVEKSSIQAKILRLRADQLRENKHSAHRFAKIIIQ